MTFTVCYMRNQALRFAKFPADHLDDIDILLLIVSADIVYLTYVLLFNMYAQIMNA